MRYQVLGPLEVSFGDQPINLGGPKQRTVLAHLILRANQIVPAPTLIDEIWGDEPPETARNTLQTYVSHLRKALGEGRIDGRPPGYRLELDKHELDAERFDELLRDARKAGATDPTAAVRILDEALALWRGPAFADLADEPSLVGEAARLNELRLAAQGSRLEALLASGEHARVVGEAEALIARDHLREGIWAALMLALYRSGRQADALAAFQRAREALADELGIDPSTELAALHERILRHDPDLDLRGEPLRGYRLLERIDDGPRATVYRAIQPKVGRDVAVKIVHARFAADPGFVRRFETDAQLIAALEHPHIVPLYDYWREPEGAYIVSRYLRGGSLASLRARDGALAPGRGSRIAAQVSSALAFAHRQGVVHGHVSAANVVLDAEGNAYLADFRIGSPEPIEPAGDVVALASLTRDLLGDAAPRELITLLDRVEAGDSMVSSQDIEAALSAGGARPPSDAATAEARNPYKGLRAFTHADARDFFGRESLVDRLVLELGEGGREARFLAVVGPSGSGKSSVVKAGLLPSLAAGSLPGSDTWFVAEMFPGAHPIEELESALLRIAVNPVTRLLERLESGSRGLVQVVDLVVPGDAEVLLVVDQFEEVFTLTEDPRERDAFLELLRVAAADPGGRVRIVITLRADFFDRPLEHPRFSELLAARTVAIPPLSPDELERAITAPAREVGASVEPGLVADIVADVASQPGTLPLVEFALTELFERRTPGGALTSGAFREIGGVTGALAARAEQLYQLMGPEGRSATRQLLLRLVTLGEGREDTRRRVTRAELAGLEIGSEQVDAVLDAFGRHRLLTFDREPSTREPTVEIAHEAFLREWPRLRTWIDETRDDLRHARLLTRGAAEWRAADHDPSFLLVGSRLEQEEAWVTDTALALGTNERDFLAASVAQRDRERADAEARMEHEAQLERRSRSRLRAMVAVLAAAALVASTLTVIAVGQRGRAIRQTRLASARELAAAATANLDVDPELSILLALEAIETASDDEVPLKEAVEALHEGIQRDRLLFTLNDPSTGNVAWSPRGDLLATGGTIGGNEAHDAVLWDATTGEVVRRLASAEGDTSTVAFSNDGSMLVTSADDSTATVWDTATGEALQAFRTQKDLITATGSFSPDGQIFALGEFCCTGEDPRPTKVRLFDTSDWHEIRRIETFGSPVFSPDGSRLLIGDGIWDVATGRRMMTTPGFDGVWRPDGEVVAQFHPEGVAVLLVDAETGRTLDRFPIPGGLIGLAWSPDGTALATGATDGVARVWDATTGAELITLVGHTGLVALVSFSPDGSRLITGGADGTARVWDVSPEGGQEIFASAEQGWLNDVGYSPDATELRTAGDPGGWVWDPVSGERLRPTSSESSFAYSSDGSKVVSNYFGTVRVTDTSSGDELFVLPDTSGTISEVAFDPTGAVLATAHDGNVVRLWDAASGAELREVEGDPLRLESGDDVGFSPDGELVASIGGRATVRVRTVDDGQLVDEWQGNSGQGRALAWDPRGGVLVTGGADGVAIWSAPGFEKIGTLSIGGGVLDLAYSADGRSLFAVGESGTTKIWNTQTWEETLSLEGDEYLTRVAVSPEGDSFATISDEGILRVFAWDLQDLIEIGRAAVSRSLTSSECLQYLHVEACPASDLPLDRAVEPSKISPVDGSYAVALNQRDYSLSLLDGAFRLRWDDGEREGTFEVVGDRLIMTDVTDAECTGRTIEGTWERVGGTLVINDLVVHPTPTCPDDGWASQVFTSEPWIRLGQLSRAG